jgi:hypothetical protein
MRSSAARRLRDEAMLVDVAAAEEERSRKLARKAGRQRKPSASYLLECHPRRTQALQSS